MERLTKRIEDENTLLTEVGDTACKCFCDNYTLSGCWECPVGKAIEKLADYEDAEEQGLLVRLPCKVGDTVWSNDFGYPESYEIKAFSYGYCDSYVEPDIEDQITFYYENYTGSITGAFPMSEIGKTVFLTREEAEKKLEDKKKLEEMFNNETRRSN